MSVTEESFLKDVAGHGIEIIKDEDVYRHIRFSRNGSSDMAFELITWPDYLCYCGDMGTYVFKRLHDMFEFFRTKDTDYHAKHGRNIVINLGYWAEKVQSVDRGSDIKEYSPVKFMEEVNSWLVNHDASNEVREAAESEVLSHADEGEQIAFKAAYEFEHDGFQFHDFCEADIREYTRRFVWACYAISWGVMQYDKEKNNGQ
jgi:hypothetical protein